MPYIIIIAILVVAIIILAMSLRDSIKEYNYLLEDFQEISKLNDLFVEQVDSLTDENMEVYEQLRYFQNQLEKKTAKETKKAEKKTTTTKKTTTKKTTSKKKEVKE